MRLIVTTKQITRKIGNKKMNVSLMMKASLVDTIASI